MCVKPIVAIHFWVAALTVLGSLATHGGIAAATDASDGSGVRTTTPIKHLVVLFNENISFDHYFGTYPYAANPPGEIRFSALPNTPTPNRLGLALRTRNPNRLHAANGPGATNPFRLDPSQNLTADQDHGYTTEQQALTSV
jgi:phospholipase C